MQQCEYPGCKNPGQKHHIVFRSQGGLDIPVNFKYLCVDHHTGNESPHKNKAIDLQYKKETQARLYKIFSADTYTLKEIVALIGCDKKNVERRLRKAPNKAGVYERENIIRAIMGGRLY